MENTYPFRPEDGAGISTALIPEPYATCSVLGRSALVFPSSVTESAKVRKFDDVEKDKNFDIVRKRFIELFALVKHGHIPEFELNLMHKLIHKNDHPTEKGGVRE